MQNFTSRYCDLMQIYKMFVFKEKRIELRNKALKTT